MTWMVKCYHCSKRGHIKRNCHFLKHKQSSHAQPKVNKVAASNRSSDEESDALVVTLALQAGCTGNWIVDSGATCHMCNNKKLFTHLQLLKQPMEVSLGDGRALQAVGRGVVALTMKLPECATRQRSLRDVLYVPALSHNLLNDSQDA